MSYTPYVAKIDSLSKHPNADRLQLATVRGQTVIVGLEIKEGDLGLFFPEGGQLGEEFAAANDLVHRTDPANGRRAGGLFEENRRVKAVGLRGVKSDGFWVPIVSLLNLPNPDFYQAEHLKDGDELKEFAGFVLATKYYTPGQQQQIAAGTFKAKREVPELARHADTKLFSRSKQSIKPGSRFVVSEKLHGTSGRTYKGRIKAEERLWDRVKAFFGRPTIRLVTGSRNVTFEEARQANVFHGSDNFRIAISQKLAPNMLVGESIFYEIVGPGLMAPANYGFLADKFKIKDLKTKYGAVVPYDYSVPEGSFDFYVYNIQQDGVDLDYDALLYRCRALGATPTPELTNGFVPFKGLEPGETERQAHLDGLDLMAAIHSVGPTLLGNHFEREGCVIRLDAPDGTVRFLKEKCWAFKALEGHTRDDDNFVDLEEAS